MHIISFIDDHKCLRVLTSPNEDTARILFDHLRWRYQTRWFKGGILVR